MDEILDSIFKAYDVRGKVGSELNPTVVEAVGRSFAEWLPEDGVVAVGYDMRPDSQELAQALIKGLTEQNRDVWDIGQVTSDIIYFAVGHHNLAGGVMITASHNPGEYNGIKFCREQARAIGIESGLLEIRDSAKRTDWQTTKTGSITTMDVTEDWITHVLSFIDASELSDLKVAVDAGNGMAGKIFPEIEPFVPFDVIEMYFELDGSFPNHIANPLVPENIVDLQNMVKKESCDVGIAFDGDGDRAVLIDEKGEPLTGTVMTALLCEYFLDKTPGATILYNAICGRIVPETIKKHGGNSRRTRVGHSYIKTDMREHKAVFGGEHSGHYYFLDNFRADSGLIASVIALYIISLKNQPLSEIVAPYREAYQQISETNFEVEDKQSTIDKVAEAFKDGTLDMLDGLTVNYPDCWLNVRPSNTEPVLRLNAEAKTTSKLDQLITKVTKIINI